MNYLHCPSEPPLHPRRFPPNTELAEQTIEDVETDK